MKMKLVDRENPDCTRVFEIDNNIEKITEQLEEGVKGVFDSGKYKEYLKFVSKFYHYSINNSILIWLQMPEASFVAGYQTWKKKFNRQVRKGETGIRILAPCPHKFTKILPDANGNPEEVEVKYTSFKVTTVFDISQTSGEDVPTFCENLTGSIKNFEHLMDILKNISPFPILFDDNCRANGCCNFTENVIKIKNGMSEQQTIKTIIHEVTHAMLHDNNKGEEKDADRNTKEIQAESVAYIVCNLLGIDTSDYSFEYIAGWSNNQETKELIANMEVIRKTALTIHDAITGIDKISKN